MAKNDIMESELLDECIAAAGPAWRRYENHPFFEALERGELSTELFIRFQANDAPFIPFIHQVNALALSKAPTGSSFSRAVTVLLHDVFVANELKTKAEILASLGVEDARFDRWALSPRREAFANHLMRVALEGTAAQIAAAIVPCTLFTHTVGRRFANIDIKGPPAFKRWAQIYADKQMHNMAEAYIRIMEEEAKLSRAQHDEIVRIFVRTTQHQVAVFDDVLEPLAWPQVSLKEFESNR